MRQNNSLIQQNQFSDLSFYEVWQEILSPSLPLLADECHLSINEVKLITNEAIKIIIYQLVTQIDNDNQSKYSLQSQPALDSMLSSLSVLSDKLTEGTNFSSLTRLKDNKEIICKSLFENEGQFLVIIGVLLSQTKIALPKLIHAFQWIVSLSLIGLAKFIQQAQSSMTQNQIVQWLRFQPKLITTSSTMAMIIAVGYHNELGLVSQLQERDELIKKAQQHANAELWQRNAIGQLNQFKLGHPFAIVAGNVQQILKPKPVAISNNDISNVKQALNNKPVNIFDKSTVQQHHSIIQKLQQYWIATAMVLSAIVFGIIGLWMTKPEPSISKTTQPIEKPRYQDVAIVKVASSTATTETQATQKNAEETKSSKAQKSSEKSDDSTAKKTVSTKSSEKKLDSDKKSDTNNQSKKKSSKTQKLAKSDSTSDKKTDEKTTKKTANKKTADKKDSNTNNQKSDTKSESKKSDIKKAKTDKNIATKKTDKN